MSTEPNVPLPYFDLLQDSPDTAGLKLYLDAVASTIADLDVVHPQERRASEFLDHLGGRMEFAIEQIVVPMSTTPRLQVQQMRNLHRQLVQSVADYKQRGELGTDYLDAIAIAIADLDEQNPAHSRTTEWFLGSVLLQMMSKLESWQDINTLNCHYFVFQKSVDYQHQRQLQNGHPQLTCILNPPCPNHPPSMV